MRRLAILAAAAGALAGLLPAAPASAHPLDEVIQQVYLTPKASTLDVEIEIAVGTLIAPAFARSLDADGNRRLSAAETEAHDVRLKSALTLTADGMPTDLTVTGSAYPDYAVLAAGGGVITWNATGPMAAATAHFAVTDSYESGQKTRVQLSVLADRDAGRGASGIERSAEGRAIAASLTPGAAAAAPADSGSTSERTGDEMLSALREPLDSPWTLFLLITVCALLGALHALTPGHGKAMLAAYLVGSRGTARQAFALGGMITATHTGSVLLLGGSVLVAGHYVVPGLLVPALKILTGVVVLGLGLRITLRRWRGLRSGTAGHGHRHGPADGWPADDRHAGDWHADDRHADDRHADDRHPEDRAGDDRYDDYDEDRFDGHDEDLDDGHPYRREPAQAYPYADGVVAVMTAERERTAEGDPGPRRELAMMGAAGGVIPCPEALGVLILAVGLNRTALGLAMIVAFSAGLAAVLVGLGLILVSARDRFSGMRPGPLLSRLPVVSAVLVVVLGIGMTVGGVLEALGS